MWNDDKAYAVYWVPVHDEPLAEFGRRWTGWCAELGEKHARLKLPGLKVESLTRGPARRGLHGIVCRSFRPDAPDWTIQKALNVLADDLQEIRFPGLALAMAGDRLALVPLGARAQLADMVANVARTMAPFHAGELHAGDQDAAARSAGTAGRATAAEAGLPWVPFDRFHLPLTDPLEADTVAPLARRLRPLLAGLADRPFLLQDLALVVDPGTGRRMRVDHRYQLADRSAGLSDTFDCRGPRTLVAATVPLAFAEVG